MPSDDRAMLQGANTSRSYTGFSLRSRRSNANLSNTNSNDTDSSSQTKLVRRESRIGLKHIFSRSKLGHKNDDQLTPLGPNDRSNGDRSSVADFSNSPYSSQHASSQSTLSTSSASSHRAAKNPQPNHSRSFGTLSRGMRRKGPSQDAPQRSLEHSPLFLAYPQAIQQATLPAPTISADALLQYEKLKAHEQLTADLSKQEKGPKDKSKKKQASKNVPPRIQWTNKIFLLTSNASVLQYAADSHYSSGPEKIIYLGHASAAFVTDVIPGQHWVLQISADVAVPETEAVAEQSRSLFSKGTQAAAESRIAANMLLVFENAGDMDTWIALVRREIEKIKSKQTPLSKVGEPSYNVREKPSQRTLIARDLSQKQLYTPYAQQGDNDTTITAADFDAMQEHCMDDVSTTNSFVSHEGRQLESLRESATRLSLMSSSQRTMITSATSSPSTSPTIDSFPRNSDETPYPQDNEPSSVKSRPNAAVIAHRRASMQPGGIFNLEGDDAHHQHEYPISASHSRSSTLSQELPNMTPNFSVPTSSSRRYSHSRSSSSDVSIPPSPPQPKAILPQRPPRGKPPTSLKTSRPLSMVADQPSPQPVLVPRPSTSKGEKESHPEPSQVQIPISKVSPPRPAPSSDRIPLRRSSLLNTNNGTAAYKATRRLSSLGAVQRHGQPLTSDTRHGSDDADQVSQQLSGAPVLTWNDQKRSRRVSMDPFEKTSSRSGVHSRNGRRTSVRPSAVDRIHRRQHSADGVRSMGASSQMPPPMLAPPPTVPLPPIPLASSNPSTRASMLLPRSMNYRRSVAQHSSDGPPLGPPPARSLPPIPQNQVSF